LSKISESQLRGDLMRSGRILYVEGHGHMLFGHVSARLGSDSILVKPADVGIEEMKPETPVTMNMQGEKIAGEGHLHSEMSIHTSIYGAREDVGAVVHTHPFNAVVLSSLGSEAVKPVVYSQDDIPFLQHGIGWYGDPALVVTDEQGAQLAAALGDSEAALLANHGIVTVGSTVVEATVRAVLLERAILIRRTGTILAAATGQSMRAFPEPVAQQMADVFNRAQPGRDEAMWQYLSRRATRVLGVKQIF
jgi:ribulose-5-phosphate 4-epimerase/fuculose-1-phosphate aldolase